MVECLKSENVEIAFGYPGAAICPFLDYLYRSSIRQILVREEQNAAHEASGYARASGKPGVCIATSGPGATNLITGIATAYMIDERYLKLLSKDYPNAQAAASEIINLKAILSLPKGTEYFFSDLHGEHEAFLYQLKSASGVVRKKVDELFEQSLPEGERAALSKLIYYPETEFSVAKQRETAFDDWCRITIYRLVEVCKEAASKYTRSKVRKKLPESFAYIMKLSADWRY